MTTHRIIRLLRVVLPLIVIALISIFVWNYRSRQGATAVPPKAADLPQNLAVLNEGFSYSRTEGGRTVFTVKAKTTLGFQDNKYMLRDVEVIVYGENDGDPERRVVSDECSYDDETLDFRFIGHVVAQLDEKTTVRTEELLYNNQSRIVVSNVKTLIEQPGTMTGQANSMHYALDAGLVNLEGNVRVQLADGATLESGTALFHSKENWADVSNGVYLTSANGWVRGDRGRAELESQSFRPRTIVIDGNVTAASRGTDSADRWNIRAGWLLASIAPGGGAEHVFTRGDVRIEKISTTGNQVLTGGEVDASIDAQGAVSAVAARQNAQMVMGSDRVLTSDTIFSNPAGGVSTEGASKLQMGESTIEGRQFLIEQAETTTTFNTTFRATLRSGERQTSADSTNAKIDSKTNQLVELVQTGNFMFSEGARRGIAQTARITDSGDVITLEGSPVVTDPQYRLEARQIRLNQKTSSFTATDKVKTVSQSGSPLVVTSSKAEGDENAIVYTGAVELWRSDSYIKADRLNGSTKNRTFQAEGNVRSDVGAVRATSDRLNYDDAGETAHYIGNVKAQRKNLRLEAADMTAKVSGGQLSDIVAQGGVVVTQGDRRGTGDSAVYNAKTEEVVLTGQQAEVTDPREGTVRGTRLTMNNGGDRIQVETEQGGRVTSKLKVRQ